MTMTNKDKTKLYTITLNKPKDENEIKILDTITSNDSFSKHNIIVTLQGEMLKTDNHEVKKNKIQRKFIYETYEDYLKHYKNSPIQVGNLYGSEFSIKYCNVSNVATKDLPYGYEEYYVIV